MEGKKHTFKIKTILGIALIVLLAIFAITSIVVFLKDRGTSDALDNNQTEQIGKNEDSDKNDSDRDNEQNSNESNKQENEQQNNNINNNNNNTNNNTNSNNNVANRDNNKTGTEKNVNEIGETAVERVEEREKIVSKEYWDWWKPTNIYVDSVSTDIVPVLPNIMVTKISETKAGNKLVYAGEKITYILKVKNNGNKDVEKIEVMDKIPSNTTFESVENDGITIKSSNDSEKIVGVKWIITVKAGEEVSLKFTVVVDSEVTGTITNKAIANGEDSNEENTSIITNSKTSEILRYNKETNKYEKVSIAKVGDEIKYTISVTNTGTENGTTTISDNIPTGTILKRGTVDGAEISKNRETLTWKDVTVPAGETIQKTFTVIVKDIKALENKKITNIATVGNKDTDKTEDPTTGINVEKTVIDILRDDESLGLDTEVKEGDVIKYKITVTNTGSENLTNVVVDEKLEGIELDEFELNIGNLNAGESKEIFASYTVSYEKDIKENVGKLVHNEVKVTGETNPTDPDKEPEKVEDKDEIDTPVADAPSVDISKVATRVKENGSEEFVPVTEKTMVRPGDVIEYVITVTNTGNVTLENIKVTDSLKVTVNGEIKDVDENGTSIIAEIKELSAETGKNVETITTYYTVVESDVVEEKTIMNTATVIIPDVPGKDSTEEVPVNPDTSVSGTKTWIDGGKVHDNAKEITLVLTRKSEKIESAEETVVATPTWNENTYTFSKLPKYDAEGYLYTYKVTENVVSGYTTEQDGKDIINIMSNINETTSVTGTKTWIDGGKPHDNAEEIILVLTRKSVKTGSVEEKVEVEPTWNENTYIFNNLPKYDAEGYLYTYKVSETQIKGYDTTISGNNFTNTMENINETTSVTGTKTWIDGGKPHDNAEEIILVLTRKSVKTGSVEEKVEVEPTWNENTYIFNNLPKYDAEGYLYTYKVSETQIKGYDTTISGNNFTNTMENINETIDISGTKIWEDNENAYGTRPTSITVNLIQNGTKIASKEVTAAYDWKYSFTKLRKYDANGKEYTYTITENPVTNYDTSVSGYNITNTLKLSLTKKATDKNGNTITELVYDSKSEASRKFNYVLTVTGQGQQTVTDELPSGIVIEDNWSAANVTVTTNTTTGRQTITWNVDLTEKETDELIIPVMATEKVFEGKETESETVKSVLNLNFHNAGTTYIGNKDYNSTKVNIFLRSLGNANPDNNDGYIYAGQADINTDHMSEITSTSAKFVSGYDDSKVNSILSSKNTTNIEKMLTDFSRDNESADGLGKYISGGLPTAATIRQNIKNLYSDKIELTDTQVVLWYKIPYSADEKISRNYVVTDKENGNKELVNKTLSLPQCGYHIDGLIVDIKDLGGYIPEGTKVSVKNVANLGKISSDATIDVIYQTSETKSATINKESVKVISKTGTEHQITSENRENYKLLNGDKIEYEITVENTGDVDLANVTVTDTKNVTVKSIEKVDAKGTRTEESNLLTASTSANLLGKTTLKSGEKYIITVIYSVSENDYSLKNGTTIENTATLAGKFKNEDFEKEDDDILNINQSAEIDKSKKAVIKDSQGNVKQTAISGDVIEYEITVTNSGNIEGNTVIKDSDLKQNISGNKVQLVVNGNVEDSNDAKVIAVIYSDKTKMISVNDLAKGYSVNVKAGETITITYSTKISEVLPGDKIENSIGNGEDEKVSTEIKAIVTTNKNIITPQNTVIVIDTSLSMAQAVNDDDAVRSTNNDPMAKSYDKTRWYALTQALDSFLKTYLPTGTQNKVTIVAYNNSAEVILAQTSSYTNAVASYSNILTKEQFDYAREREVRRGVQSDVDNLKNTYYIKGNNESKLGSGTNIEDGLIKAKKLLGKNYSGANVILMTDGEANKYMEGNTVKNGATTKCIEEANSQATILKKNNAKIYTVSLSLSSNSDYYKEELANLSSGTGYSFDTTSTTALEQAFKKMSTELVSAKLENVSTVEGKLDLSELGIVVTANTQVEIIVNGTTYNKDWNDIKESYDAENKTLDIRKIAEILGITSIKTNMQITINIK